MQVQLVLVLYKWISSQAFLMLRVAQCNHRSIRRGVVRFYRAFWTCGFKHFTGPIARGEVPVYTPLT